MLLRLLVVPIAGGVGLIVLAVVVVVRFRLLGVAATIARILLLLLLLLLLVLDPLDLVALHHSAQDDPPLHEQLVEVSTLSQRKITIVSKLC